MYGEAVTGKLMTCLNKLFLNYMQMSGFTCGLDDLVLKKQADRVRKEMIDAVHQETVEEVCKSYNEPVPKDVYFMGRSNFKCDAKGEAIDDERRGHVKPAEDIVRYL